MRASFLKFTGAGILILVLNQNLGGETFGQNKIINQQFSWQVAVSSHFQIYYYPAAENIPPLAQKYLQESYENIYRYLPINRAETFPVFLYFGPNDFEQTNIADIGEGTAGVTEGIKNRLVVGHQGSRRHLRYVLTHELTHEFEFSVLLSGFWRSARLLKLYVYPNWLMEGLAEYSAGEIDPYDREMYLRDMVANNRIIPLTHLHNFSHLLPHQITPAYKESEMLIRFIASEYGEEALFRLLQNWRAAFDSNTVLRATLGLDLETLEFKFREFLQEKYNSHNDVFDSLQNYQRLLNFKNRYPQFSESPVFSPDGQKLYFLSDVSGINEIYEYDFISKQVQPIVGRKNLCQLTSINRDYPNLAVSGDGNYLTFVAQENQQDFIFLYNRRTKNLEKINLAQQFYSLRNPIFTPDGHSLIFSAMSRIGHNIYKYNLRDQTLTCLVGDDYDNIQPAISPDGQTLVYASERPDGSGNYFYQLYQLNLTGNHQPEKIGELAGDQNFPAFSPDGQMLIFVAPNQKKIRNLYAYNLATKNLSVLTNVRGGIFEPAFSADGRWLALSIFANGEKNIYRIEWEKLNQQIQPATLTSRISSVDELIYPQKSGYPYRFRFSTDLFFPFFYYSSLDGLLLASYWQGSDLLGNHQLNTYLAYASGSDYLNAQVQYAILSWRTPVYLTVAAQRYFRDWTMTDQYQNILAQLYSAYPINRYQRLEFIVGAIWEKETLSDQIFRDTRQDVLGIGYVLDTTIRQYLEINSGNQLRLSSYFSLENFGGNYRYQSYSLNWQKYQPLSFQNVLILRNYFKLNCDRDAPLISLGGYEKISGIPTDKISSERIYIFGLEYRQILLANINYYMWYLFPDFFFKTLSAGIFTDIGTAPPADRLFPQTSDWHGDWGLNLRCYTFILQTFPFVLELRYARPLEEGPEIWYFLFGAPF